MQIRPQSGSGLPRGYSPSLFHLRWGWRRRDYLDPVAEHGHARPAALGAGIENEIIAAVLYGVHLAGVQRLDPFNGVGIDYALHIRKDHGIARLQVLQPSKVVLVVMGGNDQIIRPGGTELAAWSDLQAVIAAATLLTSAGKPSAISEVRYRLSVRG